MITKSKLFAVVFILVSTSILAQNNLNNYKYIIVPEKFDFLKTSNQYQLNDLTKFLFKKKGFSVLTEGETYPEDLNNNPCLALHSNVIKNSGLLKTKLKIVLKNCKGQDVFTSKEGESRDKEYKVAYNRALRDAFKNVSNSTYKTVISQEKTKPEKQTQPKIETPKVSKPNTPKTPQPKELNTILYAQKIENGYQLIDNTPKVIYKIYNSGKDNVFFVDKQNALIYKQNNEWFLSIKNSNNSFTKKKLVIKF